MLVGDGEGVDEQRGVWCNLHGSCKAGSLDSKGGPMGRQAAKVEGRVGGILALM
jgi:hypothetical protein